VARVLRAEVVVDGDRKLDQLRAVLGAALAAQPVRAEVGADPVNRACVAHLENIRTVVRTLAEEAGLSDVDAFARSWHILMKGSIVSAAEGDVDAARRARAMAAALIERFR
jgi:hypothetical protein